MSNRYQKILSLVKEGHILISDHGYDELLEDKIFIRDLIKSMEDSILIEDYPNYNKGPCVLLLQYDMGKKPIHVVWGIPRGHSTPAVIVTAYRPDPTK